MKHKPQTVTEEDRVLERLREMTEVELHTQIVIPMLKHQGATHVNHVHGVFEKAKDLVYVHTDFHGHARLEVCQVKNQPFSGQAGETNTITVLSQLQQCRQLEVRNPATGTIARPRGVMLLSTYELPQKDIIGAERLFKELDENDCIFVGPEEFVQKVRRHLPDLYADLAYPGGGISRVLRRYVDIYHEVAAFELRQQRDRSLGAFFVNLGVTQTGQVLDSLAKGQVKPRSPKSVRIAHSAYRDISSQYEVIKSQLKNLLVLEHEASVTPDSANSQSVSTGSSREMEAAATRGRQRDDEKNLPHVRLKEIHFEAFLERVVQHVQESVGTPAS